MTPLSLALVGYGRMGRALEQAALARGHRVACRIDPVAPGADARAITPDALAGVDVALEFTHAGVAAANVDALLRAGVPVVCGSTGWDDGLAAARAQAAERGVGLLWAPNFSLGVNVLFRLVDVAALWLGAVPGFAPFLVEEHHAAKRDAPSGTARRLAETLVRRTPGKVRYGVAPGDDAIPADLVPVAWVRAGSIPGTHTAAWDAAGETIEITHRARDRAVFAAGAILAAEWLAGRRGPQAFDAFLDDLLPGLDHLRKETP